MRRACPHLVAAFTLRSVAPRRPPGIRGRSPSLLRKTRSGIPSAISMAAPTAHDKLAEVVEAGTAIARGLDLDETLQAVVDAAARVTRASLLRPRGARAGSPHQPLHHDGPHARAARAARQPPRRDGASWACSSTRRARCVCTSSPTIRAPSASRPTTRRWTRSWACRSQGRGGVFGNLYLTEAADGDFTDEDERDRAPARRTWPPWRSRTPASTATPPSRPSRRGAQRRHAIALTGAAAAVLREHDLVDAHAARRPRGRQAPGRAARGGGRPRRVRGHDPLRRRGGPGCRDIRDLARAPRRFLRRLRPARRRRDPRRRPADRRAR